MIILKLFGIAILLSTIAAFYKEYTDASARLEAREAAEQAAMYKRMEADRIAAEKAAATKSELHKQLEAVQYQLKLLEKLDCYRSDNLATENDIKKALSLETKYNSLWTKERKLKHQLEVLEELD